MTWFILALGAAFLAATNVAITKRMVGTLPASLIAFIVYVSTASFLFLWSWQQGIPSLQPGFWLAVVGTTSLNVLMTFLYYRGLRTTDASLVLPILSTSAVVIVFSSYVLLKELPNVMGLLGVALVLFGIYRINRLEMKKKNSLTTAIKGIDSGVLCLLGVAFMAGVSISFDKLVVLRSDELFGSAVVYAGLSMVFLIAILHRPAQLKQLKPEAVGKLVLVGLFTTIASFLMNSAFMLQKVIYVTAVHRLSGLFGLMYGRTIFKEKQLALRTFDISLTLIGLWLILFASQWSL